MKKTVLILFVVLISCATVFAGFKANVGVGLQSSLGLSYEFEKLEVGADVRSFYPAYVLGLAKEAEEDENYTISTYISLDVKALYEIYSSEKMTIDTGFGIIRNPYRANNTKGASETNWGSKVATKYLPFQTGSYTVLGDIKVSYSVSEKSSIAFFAEVPLLGIKENSVEAVESAAFSLDKFITASIRLSSIVYTYSF